MSKKYIPFLLPKTPRDFAFPPFFVGPNGCILTVNGRTHSTDSTHTPSRRRESTEGIAALWCEGGGEEFHAVGRRAPGHTFWQIPLTGLGEAVAERAGFPGRKHVTEESQPNGLGLVIKSGIDRCEGWGGRGRDALRVRSVVDELDALKESGVVGRFANGDGAGRRGPRGGTTDRPADPPCGRSSMVTERGLRARGGLGHHHHRPTRRSAPPPTASRRPVAEKGDRLPEVNEDDRHLPAQGGAVAEPAERQTAKRGGGGRGGPRPKTTRLN